MSLAFDPNGSHAIVLAAGAGRRFGGGKLTAQFRGRPLVHWAAQTALSLPVEAVHVVVGAASDAVRLALNAHASNRLIFVECDDWASGLSSSLRKGIASLPASAARATVLLGDMPNVSLETACRGLLAVTDGASAALPVFRGRPAHPVAFSSDLFPAIDTLRGDQGARSLLRSSPGAVEIQTSCSGDVFDVDTIDQLFSLRADNRVVEENLNDHAPCA